MGNGTSGIYQNSTFIIATPAFFHVAFFTRSKKQILSRGSAVFPLSQAKARHSKRETVTCSRPFAKPIPEVQSPLVSPSSPGTGNSPLLSRPSKGGSRQSPTPRARCGLPCRPHRASCRPLSLGPNHEGQGGPPSPGFSQPSAQRSSGSEC